MDSSVAIVYDDDGPIEVDLSLADEDARPALEEALEYDDDEPNLVPVFLRSDTGRRALKAIEVHIADEFRQAWDASDKYRARWLKDWKLFAGVLPPRPTKMKDCANANIPMSLENVTRVAFRLHGEIFGDDKNMATVVPLQKDDVIAEALSKHFNWQLRVELPDFDRQMHRACLAFVHIGDLTVHTYYDHRLRQNRAEVLTPDEFVTPWAHTTTMPDYSDLPWYCKVTQLYTHELQAKRGEWARIDEVLSDYKATLDDEPEQNSAAETNKLQGQEKNDSTKYAAHKVLWWEGWIELPGRKDQRFVQAQLHHKSQKLLALTIHEEPHWKDLARYEQEQTEAETYASLREQMLGKRDELESQFDEADQAVDDMVDEGVADPEVAMEGMQQVSEARDQALAGLPPPPPEEEAPAGPAPPRRVPIHSFTHFVAIEPLVGNRGLSYGRIQADLQRAVNALVTQFIDAGTFANIQTWAATRKFDTRGAELKWGPGDINFFEGMDVDDIRKVLMPLSTGQANPQLMEIANLLMDKAQSSMQAADILSGEPGKSGETYKGVAARIEQATKQLSVLGRKFGNSLKQVFKNLARLNSIYLPENEIVRIADLEGAPEITIGAGHYQKHYMFEIRADMRFATNVQRVEEADEALKMVMDLGAQPGLPLFGNLALQYECIKGAFLARRRPDLVALLGARPPQTEQFGMPPMSPAPPGGAPPGAIPPGAGPPGAGPMPPQGMSQ